MCEHVRALNDFFRENWLGLDASQRARLGKFICTRGICALSGIARAEVLSRVVQYNDFNPDNDPYQEHDFGSFQLVQDAENIFWKIDYYNRDMSAGSDNPADPDATTRVLTIMLASEY